MKELPMKQKGFFFLIYSLAIVCISSSIVQKNMIVSITSYEEIVFFILVIGLTESITLCFNGLSFSTTFAVTIMAYLIFGPFQCWIILVIGYLIRVLKVDNDNYKHIFNTPLYGTLFNCSMLTITLIVASYIYLLVDIGLMQPYNQIISVIFFSIGYFLCNNFIVASLFAIRTGKDIWYYFISNIKLTMLNYAIMLPVGMGLSVLFVKYGYWGIIVPLFPVLLVKYTFTYYAEANSQFIQTVEALMNAMEARDKYTQGHSQRVAEIACILAKELEYNQWEIEKIRIAAMLHDVGKMGISDNILNKPGKLTDEEFNTIKSHPTIGAVIVKDIKKLQYVMTSVRNHHERYDGKGYPDGKGGEELDIDVYIIQLADTIDAMGSDRPYRKGLPKEIIIEEVRKYSGTQFHPKVAAAYLKIAQTSTELDKVWESE